MSDFDKNSPLFNPPPLTDYARWRFRMWPVFAAVLGCFLFVFLCLLFVSSITSHPQTPAPSNTLVTPFANGSFAGLKPVWSFTPSEPVVTSPIVAGDTVIVRTAIAIYALNLADGLQRWRAGSSGEIGEAPPLATGDTLVVPEADAGLAAYSLSSGRRLWGICAGCLGSGDRVGLAQIMTGRGSAFVLLTNGQVTAYHLDTGAPAWPVISGDAVGIGLDDTFLVVNSRSKVQYYDLQDTSQATEYIVEDPPASPPLIADGVLYTARDLNSMGINMMSIRFNSRRRWTMLLPEWSGPVNLAINNDTLYVAADRVYALSAAGGDILWKADTIGALGRPILVSGRIYIGSGAGTLYAIDSGTGQVLGSTQIATPANDGDLKTAMDPAAGGGLLIVPVGPSQIIAYRP